MAKSKTQDPLHTTPRGDEELDAYVIAHSDDEPEYLYRLWRETNVRMLHGRMASGHLQGRMLKMLVQMVRPKNILEVGTFSGYSALCLAEGLAAVAATGVNPDGHLYTFEINDEQEDFTRPWLEGSPWADRITFIIGDAITEVPKLFNSQPSTLNPQHPTFNIQYSTFNSKIDLVFLDGDKRTYCETFNAIRPYLAPGAFVLADNTLWDGHVCDPAYQRDPQTQGIRRFNDMINDDPTLSRVIIPLRDGLTIIQVK